MSNEELLLSAAGWLHFLRFLAWFGDWNEATTDAAVYEIGRWHASRLGG